MLLIEKIINNKHWILFICKGDEDLKDYKKALEVIDLLFWLDEEWELLKEEDLKKYKKRIFFRYKSDE